MRAGNQRTAEKLAALCDLLDAAGWGVAHRDLTTGKIRLGSTARKRTTLDNEEWKALEERISPRHIAIATQQLMVWRIDASNSDAHDRIATLSDREREITGWTIAGKTAPEVAVILNCSTRTVEKHLANSYRKLGVHDRASLILDFSIAGDGL